MNRVIFSCRGSLLHGSKRERHMPGEAGIWLFIFGDLMVFSLFFITYLFYRGQQPALFQESQSHLSRGFGAGNTLLMLSSSWFVATAVQAARKQRIKATAVYFFLGLLCGAAFVVNKYFEYGEKIRAGFMPDSNDFFMYYYVFTGIHLLHVLIGMGVLLFMARYAVSGNYDSLKIRNFESGASFWHVVDLLWIVLFALLYLIK